MKDAQEQEPMDKEFKKETNIDKMDFHTELDLFFSNSPLSEDQKSKVEVFIARSYQIGRDSKL